MHILASAATPVNLVGSPMNAIPRGIEYTQDSCFDIVCFQAQTAQFLQRICADKKANLNRTVITPELDAVFPGIVIAAHVGKVQRHACTSGCATSVRPVTPITEEEMPPPSLDPARDQDYDFGVSLTSEGVLAGCAAGSTVAGAFLVVSAALSLP